MGEALTIVVKKHVSVLLARGVFKLAVGTDKFDAAMIQRGSGWGTTRIQWECSARLLMSGFIPAIPHTKICPPPCFLPSFQYPCELRQWRDADNSAGTDLSMRSHPLSLTIEML